MRQINSLSMTLITLTGLLAGLWEFPMLPVEGKDPVERMWDKLKLHTKLLGGGEDIEHHHHIGLVRARSIYCKSGDFHDFHNTFEFL